MFDKSFLQSKIIKTLENNKFESYSTYGCFDIATKGEHVFLIKTLINIDALSREQAESLQTISHFLSAYPLVVSMKNNRELLDDKIIYSRFDLPVVTPKLFEEIIMERSSAVQSAKGRHTTEVNCFELREKRKELGYTLQSLSKIIGISKKALYEIENKRVNPTEETVKKIEVNLNMKIRVPFQIRAGKAMYLKPKNEFQAKISKEFVRIGLDNSAVHYAPFEIVGKSEFSIITKPMKENSNMEKEAQSIKKLADMFSAFAIFIAKKSSKDSIEGIPVFLESELSNIESSHEFTRIIEEKM
jgi:putative transcriptional regulator